MTAIPDNIAADPEQIIVELERKLDECTSERDEALERQTATADILKVIASSPSDVQPVFEAIAERSNRLIKGLSTGVYSIIGDMLHLSAFTRVSPAADAALKASFPAPVASFGWRDQIRNGQIAHIPDVEVEWAGAPSLLELARLRGFRGVLVVPLLRGQTPIGIVTVSRAEPGTFAAHDVQLLQTFAAQAVIAIENARLFEEVQARTNELAASLDELRTTQDRLVQTKKLASLGQLTAGIAHEIKNPLNFVNNFSSLSIELAVELQEAIKFQEFNDEKRTEIDDLLDTLQGNLGKIVRWRDGRD